MIIESSRRSIWDAATILLCLATLAPIRTARSLAGVPAGVLAGTTSDIYGDEVLGESLYFRSGPYGSLRNGVWFNDFRQSLDGKSWQPKRWPDTINLRAGKSIDGIQVFYGSYRGAFHGGDGGFLNKIRLYNGDRIVKVTGIAGVGPVAAVEQLTFHTRNGHTHGPFGSGARFGRRFEAAPPDNVFDDFGRPLRCYLGWISGKADHRLDAVEFNWRCPRDMALYEPLLETPVEDRGRLELSPDGVAAAPAPLPGGGVPGESGGRFYHYSSSESLCTSCKILVATCIMVQTAALFRR